jgi:hypothetical protein
LRFKRIPYTPRKADLAMAGKWNGLQSQCGTLAETIKHACLCILKEHSLGYSRNTCERLLMRELVYSEVDVRNPEVDISFGELNLGVRTSDCLAIDSGLIVRVTALPENTSSIDLTRLQSCMKQVDLSCGLLVNFGKSTLLLRAVCIK